jgi:hypothetical protein
MRSPLIAPLIALIGQAADARVMRPNAEQLLFLEDHL